MKKLAFLSSIVPALIILLFEYVNFHSNLDSMQQDIANKTQTIAPEKSPFSKTISDSSKVTCINLWATWCMPCIGEMPELNLIKEQYKNAPIQFLSLSVDDDLSKLATFNKSGKFNFTDITLDNLHYRTAILNYLENELPDHSFSIQSIPKTYLIKNKVVIKKFSGSVDKTELTKEIDKIILRQKNI